MLAIGFTGTQIGMSALQKKELRKFLRIHGVFVFHHGDCLGADEQAHELVRRYFSSVTIELHPPDNPLKRAYCDGDRYYIELPYLTRNHNIVDKCDILIAAPKSNIEELRSGTWATIRYARKQSKKIIVLQR